MFQKPDRKGGPAGEALLTRRLLDTNRWRATTVAPMFYGVKSFSTFEGQSYALRLAFFVSLNFSVFSVPPW